MTEVQERNYYELLGVERGASEDEIRASYKELARIFHPDSNFFSDIIADPVDNGEADTFKLITEAYRVLNDIKRRAEYDTTLSPVLREWNEVSEGQAPLQVVPSDFSQVGPKSGSPLVNKAPPRTVFKTEQCRRVSRVDEIRNVPSVLDLCLRRRGLLDRVLGIFGL